MLNDRKIPTNLLLSVIEYSSNAILILNKDFEIEWLNQSFSKMFQKKLKKVRGQTFDAVFSTVGIVSHQFKDLVASVTKEENTLKEFSINVDYDDDDRWFEVEISKIKYSSNSVSYALQISEISQRKKAENELQVAYDNLSLTETELKNNIEELAIVNEDLFQSKEELEAFLKKEKKQRSILEKALVKLKATQNQVVHSEKMASLEQLTKGIAHEINNAINFVYAGTDTLKALSDELIDLLNRYNEVGKSTTPKKALKEVYEHQNEIGYQTLISDLYNMIADIREGAVRTTSIVKGLHSFTKPDFDEVSPINLLEGLNATISLLRKPIHDHDIQLIKNYSELPLFIGHSSKINQVFMNILNNAIQSIIDKKNSQVSFQSKIELKTYLQDKLIVIEITDNGIGIPAGLQTKVFDPFFTTKDVGKGTGLGMSISYQIINEHNGKIEVSSKENVGSTFKISLPNQ